MDGLALIKTQAERCIFSLLFPDIVIFPMETNFQINLKAHRTHSSA